MEISSVNKFFTRLVVRWLKSDFRSAMLRSTYIQCPRWFGKKPSLKIFLSFDDPYSYLLIQLLQRIQHNLPIPIKLMMVSESLPNENIGGSQWRDWALHDSAQLAEKLQLLAIQKKPTIKAVITAQQLWQFQPKTIDNAASLFNTLWQQSFEYNYPQSTPVINSLIKNQQYLLKQGFYLPASIYFAGEWYWGVDRLPFLFETLWQSQLINTQQLEVLQEQVNTMTNGICCASFRNEESTVICQSNQYASESSNIDNSERITAYISIRSPYSYLGWIKLRRLAEKYQATIEVKPVLPLKMQGHQVSRKKAIYIMLDTMRHCQQLNIPFAQFNDPLGSGVEHCYQLFSYANSVGKGVAFFDVMFRAVYHSGIDLSLSTNLIKLCQDIGIDYEAALIHNQKNPWQSMVEQHLIDLKQLDFWGVPCFQYHDEVVWGQDRLYRIETALQKRAK